MERAAGLTHDDKPQTRLDKLDAVLALSSTSIQHAALFAEMLSLANDGRYPTLELTPEERRQRTLEALILQIQALARQNPVLIIFEGEIGAMIDRVVGNKQLPANIRQDIIERTDGIPLFVEEMTKAVLEAESEADAQRTAAAVPSPVLAVPASLQASLMARFDRLGPAKEVAQIGAALGREFSRALLAAVVRKPEAELESALDRLIAAGLLFGQGVPPHATYLFKHALVQDAAYGTLLRESRRALHARIVDALESYFTEIAAPAVAVPLGVG
jgi:predicted ATPase